jgi:hypothetical protein
MKSRGKENKAYSEDGILNGESNLNLPCNLMINYTMVVQKVVW